MWTFLIFLSVLALYAIATLFALRAARTSRTSQGAVGWVVFLFAAPHFAIPLYLFLGNYRFRGYVLARRDNAKVIERVAKFARKYAPDAPDPDHLHNPFERIAVLPVVRGNSVDLLIDGQATFDAVFAAIDEAQHYLLIQYFIIHDDELGRAFAERLLAAVKRGVTVRLLYDTVGSHDLPAAYLQKLRDGGVIVMDPARTRGPTSRLRINFRNHRKTVVADGTVGLVGGLNVGDEYMGRSKTFGHWRDTYVRLTGPVVSQLQLVFTEDWQWSMGETLADLNWNPPEAPEDVNALIVATGPGDTLETGALYFFSQIAAARERIWIASPYFVPDNDVLTALTHAALRGVEVKLLVPDMIDHRMVWLAAFSYFDEMMEVGVEIWRYTDGFMHQKVVLVDDRIAAVGTTNLDNRSCLLNFETAAMFFDSRVAGQVEQMLKDDFAKAYRLEKRLAEQPVSRRFGAPFARLFAPLL